MHLLLSYVGPFGSLWPVWFSPSAGQIFVLADHPREIFLLFCYCLPSPYIHLLFLVSLTASLFPPISCLRERQWSFPLSNFFANLRVLRLTFEFSVLSFDCDIWIFTFYVIQKHYVTIALLTITLNLHVPSNSNGTWTDAVNQWSHHCDWGTLQCFFYLQSFTHSYHELQYVFFNLTKWNFCLRTE